MNKSQFSESDREKTNEGEIRSLDRVVYDPKAAQRMIESKPNISDKKTSLIRRY